jgi:hypothetical protein
LTSSEYRRQSRTGAAKVVRKPGFVLAENPLSRSPNSRPGLAKISPSIIEGLNEVSKRQFEKARRPMEQGWESDSSVKQQRDVQSRKHAAPRPLAERGMQPESLCQMFISPMFRRTGACFVMFEVINLPIFRASP